jgi:ribonuclease HII
MAHNANATGKKTLDKLGRDERVREIYHDIDGYWLYTASGFCTDPECHTLHGSTVSDLLNEARNRFRPCACPDCERRL